MNYIFSLHDKESGDWVDKTSLDEDNIELAKEIFILDGYNLKDYEIELAYTEEE